MYKINIMPFVFLFLLTLGCKENEKNTEVTNNNKSNILIAEPGLKIKLRYKTNKADEFTAMMNNIEVDQIQKKNIHIIEQVQPSTEVDFMVAEFDAGNLSDNVLIHLGDKNLKKVDIIDISVTYGKNEFYASTVEDLEKYFVFSKCIEREPGEKTLKTIRADGILYPVIYFKRSFINALKKQ